jgi:hypothetical protein
LIAIAMPPKKQNVVESRYVARPAPYLDQVDGTSILDFLKQDSKWSDDIKFLKPYLESLAVFVTMQEFLFALSQVRVDRSLVISSPLNGFIQYNLVFDRLLKRGVSFSLQDKAILKYYVNGFQSVPEVMSKLQQYLLCESLTLKSVKSQCERFLNEFVQSLSLDQLNLSKGPESQVSSESSSFISASSSNSAAAS